MATTRRRVAAILDEHGETAPRSADCAAFPRRTIPTRKRADHGIARAIRRTRRGFDGSGVRVRRVGHARQTTCALRAGAPAGRRSVRNEREPPGAGTTALYARRASTESRRAGYVLATSALGGGEGWPSVDLPRRLERLEERMAFGHPARRRVIAPTWLAGRGLRGSRQRADALPQSSTNAEKPHLVRRIARHF